MKKIWKNTLCSLWLAGAALTSHSALADVKYHIKLSHPSQHLAMVEIEFPATQKNHVDVMLPVWRTGRYQVLNFPKNVRLFKATNHNGKTLAFEKTDKGTWRVHTQAGDKVKISYEIYGNALGERTLHIDDTHAYIDASGAMMYTEESRQQKVEVKLDTPSHWKSRSGMEKNACDHCFVAPNYDVLIDSPIETGEHEFYSFKHDNRDFELAIWGRGNHDGKKIVEDLKKIVVESKKTLGEYPFQRYLFIVHATDGIGGATEHLNSTVIQNPRWSFFPRKNYLEFIKTAMHEFVHTWNVKAYRPKEMVPYIYQAENYSKLLWVAEGHTSYYDELLSLRAGLQTYEEYMDELAKAYYNYLHQPGRHYQSAMESSLNAWIDDTGERAQNASVNIYTKGTMLATAMDILIREQTKGSKGLEHVHQYLYAHHKVSQGGFSDADMRQALKAVTGQDWQTWWTNYVDGTAEIPFNELFKKAGLNFTTEVGKDAEQKEEWFTGWRLNEKGELAIVSSVERDSPAWQAGVVAGDTLIAANGLKLDAKAVADRLWQIQTTPIQLMVFRRDEIKELSITPHKQTKGKLKMKIVDDVNDNQKMMHNAWLGVAGPHTNANPSPKNTRP